MSNESLARNEEGGNTGSDVRPIDVTASGTSVSSRDPSHFDPSLPQIKDDGDLVAFIAKYQDAFLEDMIINLSGKESSGVPCSREQPRKQVVEGLTIDILESGLFGIPIGIPFESREYNPRYNPNREGSLQVPLKRREFGTDGRMREFMVMVHLKEAPLSSTISMVNRFSGSVPPLTGVTKKCVTQDAQVGRPLTFPPVEIEVAVIGGEAEEQAPLVEKPQSSSDLVVDANGVAEQETVTIRIGTELDFHLPKGADD
ncbi:hypothetical protein F0562_032417 [Nyssa sinensis]|uniref:Uncharacterized protein n=1 Tax=Nyssa sinensis TaxID=561372 RepID=A0A5J5AQ58_9ASTE|nr:hypothetical protein F0562_032417 [Nyssa sinensis]